MLDDAGNAVLDENGDPVMGPNAARDSWVTATTLITALQFGAMAYALIAFVMFFGITSLVTGFVFLSLRN